MDCPVTSFPHVTTLEATKQVEYESPVLGNVTSGNVPNWLNGTWYRNGPGVVHFREESVKHWFDGMALARKFSIQDGEVTYVSRLVAGDSLKKNTEAGRVVVAEFGTTTQSGSYGFLGRVKSMLSLPELTDNCLINFLNLGGNIFAITESNFIRRMHPETLETLEKVDLSKNLPINIMSFHPLVDPDDGCTYTFSSSIFNMGRTKYNLLKFPAAKAGTPLDSIMSEAQAICSVDSSWRVSPSYHHSFAMTTNYAVFVEMPLKIDIPKMAVAHLRHMCYSDCIEPLPDTKTNIYLINKKTGKQHPITFSTDPLVVYHHINAYEEDDHVVLDLCCYTKNGFYDKFVMSNLEKSPAEFAQMFSDEAASVRSIRIVMPLTEKPEAGRNLVTLPGTSCTAEVEKSGLVSCTTELIIQGMESPSINDKLVGKKYKYFYSNGGHRLPPGEFLAKVDVEMKERVQTWQEKGCWVNQAVFVNRPGATDEEDGIVMSSVIREGDKPFLLILDGKTFKEVARVQFDANIPPDIHGIFVPRS